MLPLLRPAIVAALVYSFVRAMTAVSAVIFLVTRRVRAGDHLHRRPRRAGEFGLAIAYSSVLIVVMLVVILLIQLARRRAPARPARVRCHSGAGQAAHEPPRSFRRASCKRYGAVTAVDGRRFTIEAGTLVTLLGPSGCGKTTTLRMIAGLEMPSEGRILIGGRDVTHLRPPTATSAWCSSPTRCSRT